MAASLGFIYGSLLWVGLKPKLYRRYSMEELAKFYREGEHALLVFTETGEVAKIRREIEERRRRL